MLDFIETIVDSVQVARFQWRIHFLNCLVGLVGSSRTLLDVVFSRQPGWSCEDGWMECERRRKVSKYFIPCKEGSILDGVQLENGSENYFLVAFKLVCKDDHFDWNLPLASSSFFMGTLFGGCLLGILSDSRGRRLTVLISLLAALLSSLLTVFTPFMQLYVFGRFLDGVCFGGYSINTFIISIEYSKPGKTRHLCMVSYFILWGPAIVLMMSFNQLLRHNSWHAQAAVSALLILILLITTLCLGVESAPWTLTTTAHTSSSYKNLLTTIAKIIKMEISVPSARFHRSQSSQSVPLLDLIRGPRYTQYRRSVLLLLFIWFVTAVSYYLSYYSAFFKQSPKELGVPTVYLLLLSAGCDVVGFSLISPLLAKCLSRRHSLFCVILTAASVSFAIIVENKYSDFVLLLISKTLSSALFSLVYLVTAEVAPTPARGFVCGLCFGVSRIGAMLAPYVNYISDILEAMPHVTVGTALLLSFVAAWALPETKDIQLLHDYHHVKEFYRKPNKYRNRDPSKSLESSI